MPAAKTAASALPRIATRSTAATDALKAEKAAALRKPVEVEVEAAEAAAGAASLQIVAATADHRAALCFDAAEPKVRHHSTQRMNSQTALEFAGQKPEIGLEAASSRAPTSCTTSA